jgi:predicted nucleic acid-binding protein
MAEIKALVDLNVILDVLLARQEFYNQSASVWAAIESGKVKGFVAAHSVATLFYLYARQSSAQEASRQIRKLLQVFSVAAVDQAIVERAISLEWNDFEDALQLVAAEACHADYLVTRNRADFKTRQQQVEVLSPPEFNALFK